MSGQGKGVSVITPFTSQHIQKKGVAVLLEKKEVIIDMIIHLNGGEELSEEECLIKLQENELFLKIDGDYSLVHVRKYWWSTHQQKLLPHKRGERGLLFIFYFNVKNI